MKSLIPQSGNSLNVRRIFEHFGGRKKTHERLIAAGEHIGVGTLDKWRLRGNIPTGRMLTLIEIARRMRRPLDIQSLRGAEAAR